MSFSEEFTAYFTAIIVILSFSIETNCLCLLNNIFTHTDCNFVAFFHTLVG